MKGDLPRGVETNERGKAVLPEERFSSHSQVQETCGTMLASERERVRQRVRVDQIANGHRPINQKVLDDQGFGWFPNTNYGEMAGYIQASQTPLFDLVMETPQCIDVTLDIDASSNAERDDWEDKIQKHFTWLLHVRWRQGFNFHISFQQLQMLKHGIGTHIWPTNRWTPRTPRAGHIIFPSNAPLNFNEDGEYFMAREFYPAHTLYGFIRNEDAATRLGWRPKAVWQALAAMSKSENGRQKTLEDTQRAIRRGDIGWANQAGLWVNCLFVREIDTGKVTQYIVSESQGNGVKDFLFKRRNQYDEWPLVIFNYDVGDGDLNSVYGLGTRTAAFFELSNRLKNAMAAQIVISMFPQIKQTREDVDPDKLKLLRLGALSILPYGVEPSLIQFPPLNNGPLAFSREMKETMRENNASMTGGTPDAKDRETALSFSMRAQDQARVANGLQSLYESNLQQFYDKMLRMALDMPKGPSAAAKMAEEFRERCRKDNVPDEALKSSAIAEVREVTSSGSGSAAARLQGLMTLMNYVFPNTTEEKRINILRDLTGNTMGGAKVDRYAPSLGEAVEPTSEESFAALESSQLVMGGDAVVSGDQNHTVHAAEHLRKGDELRQLCEAGQEDPAKCLMGLQKLLPHTGEHLDKLQSNPMRKAEFDALSEQWDELAKFMNDLATQLQDAAEAEADEMETEETVNADVARKDRVAEADIRRKDTVAQANLGIKVRKEAFNQRLKSATAAAAIQRQQEAAATPRRNGSTPPLRPFGNRRPARDLAAA